MEKISWVSAIGTGGFATYTEKMKKYIGEDIPIEYNTYSASEAFMGAARFVNSGDCVLLPHSAFYEFIPDDTEDEENTLNIDQLEVGKNYEIVITNTSGFYRYRIKDAIKVVGFYNEAPLIQFVYRKNQIISIAGEKTNDESARWAVKQFEKDYNVSITDYSIYADTDANPGRYVVFMEPDHLLPKGRMKEYARSIEMSLGKANPSFGTKIANGILGATQLHFVQKETYALYRELQIMRGASPNQLKPVRSIDTIPKEKFFFGLIDEQGEI